MDKHLPQDASTIYEIVEITDGVEPGTTGTILGTVRHSKYSSVMPISIFEDTMPKVCNGRDAT